MDDANSIGSILERVIDPGVRNALVALFQEVDAANSSPERTNSTIKIIVEVQDPSIELPDEFNFADPVEVCKRNNKTPMTIIDSKGREVTVCCPGDPDCPK